MELKHTKIVKIEATIDTGDREYTFTLAKANKAAKQAVMEEIEALSATAREQSALKTKLATARRQEAILEKKLEIEKDETKILLALDALGAKIYDIEAIENKLIELGAVKLDIEEHYKKLCKLEIAPESAATAIEYAERISWANLYENILLFWQEADTKK